MKSCSRKDEPSPNSNGEFTSVQKYRTLAGCIIINLAIGTVYVWGGVSPYVCSFLKARDDSITQHSVSMIFPFMQLLIKLSSAVGVFLCDKFSTKAVTYVTGFVMLLSILLVSFQTSLAGFIVFYMCCFGLCSGILYLIPLKIVWELFPERKGLVSGFVLAGYGFASFIFKFVAQGIVNPDNHKPSIVLREGGETVKYFSEEVYENVPTLFRVLFLCYTAITITAILLIKFPHEKDSKSSANSSQNELAECQTVKQGMSSYGFWSMFLLAFTMIFFGQFFINNYKFYGVLSPSLNDDSYLTLIGSLASACNGISRIFWAVLYDKYGFRNIFFTAGSLQVILTLTITFTTSSKILYGIWLCLSLWCMGCYFCTFGPRTYSIFGKKLGTQIYGFVLYGVVLGNILSLSIRQAGLELSRCFWLGFVLSLAGLFIAVFQKATYSWAGEAEGKVSPEIVAIGTQQLERSDSLTTVNGQNMSMNVKYSKFENEGEPPNPTEDENQPPKPSEDERAI